MQITVTNAGAVPLFVSLFYKELAVGESVTVSKSRSELDSETEFKKLVVAGTLVLAFTEELGDDALIGTSNSPSFSNATRPLATAWPLFCSIWNTSDNALNFSDGTNWRDGAGNIT